MSRRCHQQLLAALLVLAPLAAPVTAADLDVAALVDPTRPLNHDGAVMLSDTLDGGPENFRLNSVLIRGDSRIAVINNQRVRVGQSLGRARVTQIDNQQVVLDLEGERRTLRLYGSSVKTPVSETTE